MIDAEEQIALFAKWRADAGTEEAHVRRLEKLARDLQRQLTDCGGHRAHGLEDRGMSGWKTWESAPKDGQEILARFPHQGNVVQIFRFNQVMQCWESKGVPRLGLENQECEWHEVPGDSYEHAAELQRRLDEIVAALEPNGPPIPGGMFDKENRFYWRYGQHLYKHCKAIAEGKA